MAEHRVHPDQCWTMLREGIGRNTASRAGTHETWIKGFAYHRYVNDQPPQPHFYRPVVIVVAQGKKLVRIGSHEHRYGENIGFVAGVDMPVTSCALEASEEKPYLALSLQLDTGLLASLAARVPAVPGQGGDLSVGAALQELDPDLLDALVRLVDLSEKAERIPVMEDLLLREIHYRLLVSPFGNALRSLNTFGSQGNQITRAIAWLKEHYAEPFQVESLAARSHMATSTFHKYFKEITTLSPLQYQKRLRLAEAQRLMLSDGYDVTRAALAVGYESSTQFIREYKRLFGDPPRKNVMRIKNTTRDAMTWTTA